MISTLATVFGGCAFIVWLGPIAVARDNQGSGSITLHGQILESACALDANSAYQVIELDPLPMGQLIRLGESAPRTFTLRLVKCLLTRPDPSRPDSYLPDWQHVRVTFDGLPDMGGRFFAAGGTAQGLALRITDMQGQDSKPGVPMGLTPLTGEDQELRYVLQLVGNGRPMAVGSHRAAVRFRLEYF
ncbi:fimbrial protein [Pseudomonas fragi]|jgi:fimbrial protein|uniref:fimbrial protein n=1 Tax=Pseudomonas fragi TaxID=296 RepID=UPI000BA1E2BE|nr:fimbrial protein [Pseudomonas fragi]PAA31543.1 fimbrial protein [Pseudomonas fragi]